MKVVALKKTCVACPSQWEETLEDGRAVYAHYRHGELSVGIGDDVGEAIDNGMSDHALYVDDVGDWLDGYMDFEELKAHLRGYWSSRPTSSSSMNALDLPDRLPDRLVASLESMRIDRDHRVDGVAGHLGEIGVIDSRRAQMRDIGVTELMRRGIQAGRALGGHPDVAVEVALAP